MGRCGAVPRLHFCDQGRSAAYCVPSTVGKWSLAWVTWHHRKRGNSLRECCNSEREVQSCTAACCSRLTCKQHCWMMRSSACFLALLYDCATVPVVGAFMEANAAE